MTNAIYFYGNKGKYGFMSNFYHTVFYDENGLEFNCSEQFLMYNKAILFDSSNSLLLQDILFETSPVKIKKFGRVVKNFNENVWNEHKYNIMINALRLKFNQNLEIKRKLIETGDKILYEASKNDKIWGIGYGEVSAIDTDPSKYGQNLLGKALMQVRQELV
jgi:ribA/ribD-fused uncharacterized protein